MHFPPNIRSDLLELLGSAPIDDEHLEKIIEDLSEWIANSETADGKNHHSN